jgi:hypothetical protein
VHALQENKGHQFTDGSDSYARQYYQNAILVFSAGKWTKMTNQSTNPTIDDRFGIREMGIVPTSSSTPLYPVFWNSQALRFRLDPANVNESSPCLLDNSATNCLIGQRYIYNVLNNPAGITTDYSTARSVVGFDATSSDPTTESPLCQGQVAGSPGAGPGADALTIISEGFLPLAPVTGTGPSSAEGVASNTTCRKDPAAHPLIPTVNVAGISTSGAAPVCPTIGLDVLGNPTFTGSSNSCWSFVFDQPISANLALSDFDTTNGTATTGGGFTVATVPGHTFTDPHPAYQISATLTGTAAFTSVVLHQGAVTSTSFGIGNTGASAITKLTPPTETAVHQGASTQAHPATVHFLVTFNQSLQTDLAASDITWSGTATKGAITVAVSSGHNFADPTPTYDVAIPVTSAGSVKFSVNADAVLAAAGSHVGNTTANSDTVTAT